MKKQIFNAQTKEISEVQLTATEVEEHNAREAEHQATLPSIQAEHANIKAIKNKDANAVTLKDVVAILKYSGVL
jgi:hypothetical protein